QPVPANLQEATTQVTSFAPLTLAGPVGTVRTLEPTFSWAPVAGADNYDLWVDDVTTGQSQVIRQKALPGATPSFSATSPLTSGNTYQWWVRPYDAQGHSGVWSRGATMTTSAVPVLLYPEGPINNPTPTFQWSTVGSASQYELWVSD